MRFHLESTSPKSQLARAIKPVLESLEQRQMLTIVEGGQTAFYQNLAGQAVKIVVDGGGSLAFIGSSQDANGNAQLNDIPMTIIDSTTGQVIRENLGGFAGRDGIEPITNITNTFDDSYMSSSSGGGFYGFAPADGIAFEALGTNTLGRTYAINRRTEGPGASANTPVYDVVGVNNNNGKVDVLDSIAGKILTQLRAVEPEFDPEDLGDLIGADFDLADPDLLYFAMEVEFPFREGDSFNRQTVPVMLMYNIRSETVQINSFFGATADPDDEFVINDFTFLNEDQIAFFGSVKRGDNDAREGLFISDKTTVGPAIFRSVTIGTGDDAEDLTEVAALESIDGNFIIAVDSRSNSAQLVRIDLDGDQVTGASNIGPVVDPDEPANATDKRGGDIADLSYNSRLVDNSFQIGKRGVLLGTDASTDELVGIDLRQRFPNSDVYSVIDAEATTDTSLLMTVITPSSNQNLSFDQRLVQGVPNPYASSAGSLGTFMGDPGQDLPVAINLGNGGVFIGARSNDADDRPIIPVLDFDLRNTPENYVGTLPGVKLSRITNPGIYIAGSINDVFIAGTITGRVSIDGSVDTFYAGNVVTGDPANGQELTTDNFFVGGDLRNLLVAGGIGELANAPGNFYPQTDFAIGGRVMQMKAGGTWKGAMDIAGKTNSTSNRDVIDELETVVRAAGNNVANAFLGYQIANQGVSRNDAFDAPQMLGSISDNRGRGGSVIVNGSINNGANFNDNRDTYGLALVSGEGASVELLSAFGDVNVEVYDPNGRLYYTDWNNQSNEIYFNTAFTFTADKPGIWRIVAAPVVPAVKVNAPRLYQLTLDRIGGISLGGLVADNVIVNKVNPGLGTSDIGIKVRSGDLGGIFATNELYGASQFVQPITGRDLQPSNPIWAQRGSIRAIEAGAVSHLDGGTLSEYPNIVAGNKIGLIQGDDRLYFNDSALTANALTNGEPSAAITSGGDIQVIETDGNFSGILSTNGSIGVIRAESIDAIPGAITGPSYFRINADGKGNDELGLIDCNGDFGNFATGGPALSSGGGANIRYLRVGGATYRDRFFGFGGNIVQTVTNSSITVTDDTGAEVSVKPIDGYNVAAADTTTGGTGTDTTPTGTDTLTTGLPDPFGGAGTDASTGSSTYPDPFGGGGTGGLGGVPDPFGGDIPVITDPTDPAAGVPDGSTLSGTLRLETYPVRTGGFVITTVTSSTGISVATNREGGGGVADITSMVTSNVGTPLVADADGNLVASPTILDPLVPVADQLDEANRFLDVILVGNSRINVMEIGGSGGGPAEYTRIDNYTDGEILNIRAQSAAAIVAEWLGVSRPVSGAKIEGLSNVIDARFPGVANLYPFNNAKNMIFLTNAGTIGARGPMGNITVQARIQNLVANAGNQNVKGVLEGIVAPVLVLTNNAAIDGNIDRIDIGEGLPYSGSGEIALSGIYSTDEIGTITNINGGGDLRGDVIARSYLNRINITGNGSILDSDIYVTDIGVNGNALLQGTTPANGFQVGLERVLLVPTISLVLDTPTDPAGVGKITITGSGGMMNSRILGYNVGKVTANGGSFGIFTSDFISETGGTMGGISADGLGIRQVNYSGGSFTGDIIATGKGKLRNIDEFSRSVRGSESGVFDASSGVSINEANDLNLFLGTDNEIRSISGVTNDGYIEDSVIQSNRSIRSVQAFEIRTVLNPLELKPRDETYPSQINTGGSLPLISTQRNIDGLRVVAGTVGTIRSGYDIKNFQLQTTGFVNNVTAKRNIAGTANLNLVTSGSLNQLAVGGNMNGTAYVAKGIRSIVVGGNLSSQKSQGGIYTAASINLVDVGGDITSGTYLHAKNVIKSLVVDGDIQSGAEVLAKSISNKDIAGEVDGVVS